MIDCSGKGSPLKRSHICIQDCGPCRICKKVAVHHTETLWNIEISTWEWEGQTSNIIHISLERDWDESFFELGAVPWYVSFCTRSSRFVTCDVNGGKSYWGIILLANQDAWNSMLDSCGQVRSALVQLVQASWTRATGWEKREKWRVDQWNSLVFTNCELNSRGPKMLGSFLMTGLQTNTRAYRLWTSEWICITRWYPTVQVSAVKISGVNWCVFYDCLILSSPFNAPKSSTILYKGANRSQITRLKHTIFNSSKCLHRSMSKGGLHGSVSSPH